MQAQTIMLRGGGGGGSVSLSITQPVVSLLAGQPGGEGGGAVCQSGSKKLNLSISQPSGQLLVSQAVNHTFI